MEPLSPPGLADPDHRVRMRTIYELVEQDHPQAGKWIRPLLRDRESPVRNAAIVALGQLHDQGAFDSPAICLTASMSRERSDAVHALVALGNPLMRVPLLQGLKVEPSFMVRMEIIKALSAFRDDEEAIEAISATLTDTNHETTINGLCVRNSWVAQQAIVMIRSPEQPSHLDWPE